jgi:hypothetical protein
MNCREVANPRCSKIFCYTLYTRKGIFRCVYFNSFSIIVFSLLTIFFFLKHTVPLITDAVAVINEAVKIYITFLCADVIE